MHNTAPENIDFNRTPCFWIYDSPEYKEYPMHWHNAFEILMPTENVFPVICEDTEYILKENDILIIPPGALHNLKAQHGRRIIMLCDNGMIESNPALRELNTFFSHPILINNDYDDAFIAELNEIVMEMVSIFDSSPLFCEIILYQKLITLLLKIAEYKKGMKKERRNKNSDKTELIKEYIDSFYMNPINLDTLSKAIGYSKYHISRILNSNGVTFNDMLSIRRIKASEIMLRNNSCPITQIAFNSGFTSITTFNRIFKKIKGCTPTEFKEMYLENNSF